MAAWVEGKPAPKNTLSDVNDIVNETKSPWTRISPLSDASNKALELAPPISPHIFDNDGKLNYNLGSITKPVTGPKPRLSPRPFTLEKSSVPYTSPGTTQAPHTAPKPISVASKIRPSGKLAVDTGNAKASFRHTQPKHAPSGTVLSVLSSFAPKSSIGSDNISWIKAGESQDGEKLLNLHSTPKLCNAAVSSSTMVLNSERVTEENSEHSETKPTTLVILETSVQKLKSKKSSEGDKDIEKWTSRNNSQDQELQGTMKPLSVLSKPTVHSRKYSPSATQGFGTSKPAPLLRATSLGFLGKWDQVTEEGKDKTDKEKYSTESPPSPRVQLRKPRPLSAWLPRTDDQKSESPSETMIKHDEKASTPEKPWLKKPRPLSMDLTARFEAPAHKRNVPPAEDSKENVPIIKAASILPSKTRSDATVQQEQSAAEAEKCWSSASSNDDEDETESYLFVAKKKFNNSPKMDISKKDVQTLTLYERDNKEKIASPERKIPWKNDATNDTKTTAGQGEEEKEERIPTTSLKTEKEKLGTDQEQLKNWANKELDEECSDLERALDDENSSLGCNDRGSKGNKVPVSGGIIKRRIGLLLDSASSSTAKTDSPQAAAVKEKINIRVRHRIQSFSSGDKDSKWQQLQSSQRRSYQPRPLSSDITKRFDTRAIGDEGYCEKQVDMAVSSAPEHSILQNTPEQGGRESLEKENEDETDLTKNDRLHLMDTATEFRWRRRQSIKKVSRGFDKGTTDEKTRSEKISRKNSFSSKEEEVKGQITETGVPMSVASMTKVGTENSAGQKTVTASMDSDLCIKAVRVSIIENEVQRHKVPEFVYSEDPSYSANSCFDKDKRSEQTAQLKNYTTMKTAVEVIPSDKETNKTKSLELEAAPLEGKKKIYFETEEKRVSEFSVKTPPSSKITEQNVSGLLSPTSYGKIDILQNVSKKAVCRSPPTKSEDKVTTRRTRRSHSTIDQTKLEENVYDARRRWNQPPPAENSSILESPSTAPNSEIKVVEVLNAGRNQQSHIELLTTAKVDSDKVGKKQLKTTPHNSHSNTERLTISKGSSRDCGSRKYNDAANQEVLPSAGSKGSDDVDAGEEAKGLLQGDGTVEFCGKVLPNEGRDKRSKTVSLEPNSTIFTTDQVSDCSTETSYVKHRYASEPLSTSVSWSVDRSKDGFFEEYYPKMPFREKPKTTLLSESFLDMPWTNGKGAASEESHVAPTVKQSKMATTKEKSRKSKDALNRNRHNVLDLDTLMADYIKEKEKRKNEESKTSHYHHKKDNHCFNTHQKDYEEQCTQKMIKSADQGFGLSSSSGKNIDTSDRLNKKRLHCNRVVDLDALMADYANGISEPIALVQKTVSSELVDGMSPTVKIQKSSSSASREAKISQKNDQIKKRPNEELKRDACDSATADFKRQPKDEKRKSRPSSAYNEYDELEKYDLCSNGQKSEGKHVNEEDTYTSAPANITRQPKHEKKKSRPSSTYIERSDLEQPELHVDGQKSDGSRDKGKAREDDHSEPMPRNRKKRGEERKSKVTPVERDCSAQTFDGHSPDGKTGIMDYLTSSRWPVHGSSYLVLEKEKHVEMSVDDRQRAKVENRPAGRKEESEQKSPRIMNKYPKDLSQSVPEAKKSKPLEIHRQTQKAVDGLLTSQEETSNSRSHEGRKSYSTGGAQSRVTETLMRVLLSKANDKTDSHCIERKQSVDLPSKTQRKIGDRIQSASKTKKQNERKVYSRRSVQQEKRQEHKTDRVKQCCRCPSAKGKDTDTLVQERDQFHTTEERDQYGTYEKRDQHDTYEETHRYSTYEETHRYSTYEERGSSPNEEDEPYSKYEEHKPCEECQPCEERRLSEEENCSYRPLSPYKEPTAIPVASPARSRERDRVSLSSQLEKTPASELTSSVQGPRSTSYVLSGREVESPDDTDSSQSSCLLTDVDPTPHGFSFLEPVTTLDSGAQKSRIQLSRKNLRRAPTKHRKAGIGDQSEYTDQMSETTEDSWIYKDSTEHKSVEQEELVEDEVITPDKLTLSQCQKVAMFPGMDPAVLKACLEKNKRRKEIAHRASEQNYRPAAQRGISARPFTIHKDEGSEERPPSWLQELKSKKRLSLHQTSCPNWSTQ